MILILGEASIKNMRGTVRLLKKAVKNRTADAKDWHAKGDPKLATMHEVAAEYAGAFARYLETLLRAVTGD